MSMLWDSCAHRDHVNDGTVAVKNLDILTSLGWKKDVLVARFSCFVMKPKGAEEHVRYKYTVITVRQTRGIWTDTQMKL